MQTTFSDWDTESQYHLWVAKAAEERIREFENSLRSRKGADEDEIPPKKPR